MSPSRRGPRLVLAIGTIAGLISTIIFVRDQPEQIGIATDVYHLAATTLLEGGDIYADTPPDHPGFSYLYPPFVTVAFVPHALTGSQIGAYALQTVLNLVTLGAFAVVLLRSVEHAGLDLDQLDRALIAAFAVAFFGTASVLVMGQVNVQLLLALTLGVLWLETDREAESGVVLAAAALVKLFPALVGAWLLRRRAWTTIVAATATGIGVLLAGILVFGPEPTVTYFTEVVPNEASTGSFADGPNADSPYMTIRRQLAFLVPGLSAGIRSALGFLVMAPIVLACYRSMVTYRERLVAYGATILAILHLFALEPFYLSLAVFPLVPLVYLFEYGKPRWLFLVGTLVMSVPVRMSGIELWADVLPTAIGDVLVTAAEATFAFILPQTIGLYLVLAGFVLHQHRAAGGQRLADDQSSATSVSGR